jgi:hypothetical protein
MALNTMHDGLHIALGMPNRDDIKSECSATAEIMAWHMGRCGYNFTALNVEGAAIDENRNTIFRQAQEKKVDYLFFLDSDTEYKHSDNVIEKMINYQKDVVMGITYISRFPYRPNIFKWASNGEVIPWHEDVPDYLFKVEAAGNGFQLISKKVLDAFTPLVMNQIGEPFALIYDGCKQRLREDLAFCWRLKLLGLELWADPNLKIIHQKKYPITEDFYKTAMEHEEVI